MKIALVHELLTMRGGAERVLRILADMFPEAPIYTLLYDKKKLGDWFPPSRVRTSEIQNDAWLSKNHHLYLNRFPHAVEAWDFSEFDVVLSTSSAFVHGIITNGAPKHLCYVHSPARYLWDRTYDVLDEAGKGLLGPLKKHYLQKAFHTLRIWDSEVADRPDTLLAASNAVQRRIELYWRRTSAVVTPPIDDMWFEESSSTTTSPKNYFLIVSSLVRYKRIELAVKACTTLNVPLKIVGEGPDLRRLQKFAGPTIEFTGWKKGSDLKDLYANAIATIFPGDEDFGLVPLESMACGTPVVAYKSGGALETMIDGQTGEFFTEPTSESLQEAMKKIESQYQIDSGDRYGTQHKKYSREALVSQAKKFSRAEFEKKIRAAIASL